MIRLHEIKEWAVFLLNLCTLLAFYLAYRSNQKASNKVPVKITTGLKKG